MRISLSHHNTVSAAIVGAGRRSVIPDEISLTLDGRLLPGFTPEQLFAELRAHAGVEMEQLIHAGDERIPADALEFGTTAIGRVLERFG